MKQDRKLNRWVLLASILSVVAGFALLIGGAALAILGFLKPEQISKIDEIVFFLNQEGFIDLQLKIFNNKILETEFLYLFAGIIVAVIGLLFVIFSLIAIRHAKKRKVVRHKLSLLLFTLLPLAIVGCAIAYLILEKEMFRSFTKLNVGFGKNIMYASYGVAGLFGVIALLNLLGILFGRSEKFVSNDNEKYTFDNSNLPNRAINNGVGNVPVQQSATRLPQQAPAQRPVPAQPMQGQPVRRPMPQPQAGQRQVTNQPMRRPIPGQPVQRPQGQPMQPARPQMARPQGQMVRPNPSAQQPQRQMGQHVARPQGMAPNMQARRPVVRRCPRCGKVLNQGENFCAICGYKIINS